MLLLTLGIALGVVAPHISASEDTSSTKSYVVRAGDTLSSIADESGTTVEELAALNGLEDVNHIVTGTTLAIPVEPVVTRQAVAEQTYRVQPGDTLWEIAASFGLKASTLAEMNGLSDVDQIYAGDELRVPVSTSKVESEPDREHTVQAGETVSSIAEAYGVSVSAILDANHLTNTDIIRIGQVLLIPAQSLPELPAQTASVIEEMSSEYHIDPYLLLALTLMESGWQSQVVSHTGAIGLMQLMPDTAKWTVAYLTPAATNWNVSMEDNARVGAAYLNHLLFLEAGDVEGALASYYQGWGSYKADGMLDETRDYVDGILALAERLRSQG